MGRGRVTVRNRIGTRVGVGNMGGAEVTLKVSVRS